MKKERNNLKNSWLLLPSKKNKMREKVHTKKVGRIQILSLLFKPKYISNFIKFKV